jgi:L-alanine-DL-glutamate epimerase-like enolase superfamily enzyme
MRIDRVEVFSVRLPLVRPFQSAAGETDARDLGILRLSDSDGRVGLGEITPYPDPAAPPLSDLLAIFERDARHQLVGASIDAEGFVSSSQLPAAVRSAVDIALLDLQARREEVRVADLLADPLQESVAVNATVTAVDPREVAELARRAVDAGYSTIKLKVGFTAHDEARVGAIREAVGFEPLLRLDVNGRWGTEEAIETIAELEDYGIELVEQPVDPSDIDAMRAVRESSVVPIVADEGVRELADLELHLAKQACDGVAVKLSQVGGISSAMALADAAAGAGLLTFVTSTLDGPIGLAAGLHFAAARADFSLANGLATGELFDHTYGSGFPAVEGGALALPTEPGLGVDLDEDALTELSSP